MDLKNLNVTELSTQQTKNTDGGWVGIAVAVGLYVMAEWDSISDGFNDSMAGSGYNYTR